MSAAVGRMELSGHVLRGSDGQGAIADTPERARRLAACWNAMEGWATEQVERMADLVAFDGRVAPVGDRVFQIMDENDQLRSEYENLRVERTNCERRIAAQRDAIGRLHARIGTLQDEEVQSSAAFNKVSARFAEMQTELGAARALLAEVLALRDAGDVVTADNYDNAPVMTDEFRAVVERIRALLKGGA